MLKNLNTLYVSFMPSPFNELTNNERKKSEANSKNTEAIVKNERNENTFRYLTLSVLKKRRDILKNFFIVYYIFSH